MLRKEAKPGWDNTTKEQTGALETLKTRLISRPILALPKNRRPYMINPDASAYKIGATLLQQQDEEEANDLVPIGYWSKTLTDTEWNYSKTERECNSVVWSVTTLRTYIEGPKFTVRTEHDALRWLMTIFDATARLLRRRLRFSELEFTDKYSPGLVQQVPDALSRVLIPEENDDAPIDEEVPTYCDHEGVFVTTRRKLANSTRNPPAIIARKRTTRKRTARTPTDARE